MYGPSDHSSAVTPKVSKVLIMSASVLFFAISAEKASTLEKMRLLWSSSTLQSTAGSGIF